jgi:hypothetical protein
VAEPTENDSPPTGRASLGSLFLRHGVLLRRPRFTGDTPASIAPLPAGSGDGNSPAIAPVWVKNPRLGPKFGFAPPGLRFAPGPEAAPPNPPVPNRGGGAPLVPRDATAEQRLRRHTESVQKILNSLIRRGDIVYLGQDEWALRPGAKWVEGRSPGPTDDGTVGVRQGDLWLDTSGPSVWMAANVNPGVAVWVQLG